jgi:hypothetical protein
MLFGSTPFSANAFAAGGEVRFEVVGVASVANTNAVVAVGGSSASTGVSTPALSVTINGVNVTAVAVVSPTGVAANGSAQVVVTQTQNVFTITSAGLTVSVGLPSILEGAFDYESITDRYSRHRTVYLAPLEGANTVHILPESNVVYINKGQGDNTVHIVPENNVVYINKRQGDNTVHIAA